jgi:hypothetical protein
MISGVPLKADLAQCSRHFAFVPIGDIAPKLSGFKKSCPKADSFRPRQFQCPGRSDECASESRQGVMLLPALRVASIKRLFGAGFQFFGIQGAVHVWICRIEALLDDARYSCAVKIRRLVRG